MDLFLPQVRECLDAGLDIVRPARSWLSPVDLSQGGGEIDAAAKRVGELCWGLVSTLGS